MEARLDPEKVREARKRLAATLADRDRIDAAIPDAWKVDDDEGAPHITVPLAEFRLLLAVLSEGREASTPFLRPRMYAGDPDHYPVDIIVTVGSLRRLAAFNELVSQEKP